MPIDEERTGREPAVADRVPIFALLGANIISSVGNNTTTLAVAWFVLETTAAPPGPALSVRR
jgi:hypothetical protein